MKKLPFLILGLVGILIFIGLAILVIRRPEFISPLSPSFFSRKINFTPYSFEALSSREYFKSEIKLEEVLEEEDAFTSYLFSFASEGRKITGMANIPKRKGKLPVAILLRGWVDEEIYQTGMGTEKMADFLAENGFLTLAPDFLGYGGSDPDYKDMLLARFSRPIAVITLLASLDNLPQADVDKVVFWGHSNGGQIALSVLEITGKNIPTSLWAPVSAAFPQSVLYFAEEMEDKGEKLRKVMADFEKEYDSSKYSITTYFDLIDAPLIIHQGTADEAIPKEWSDELVDKLRGLEKEVTYFIYSGENHNFTRGSAPQTRQRDLAFFRRKLGI